VIIFTGEGDLAFCSGGDQRIAATRAYVGDDGVPRAQRARPAAADTLAAKVVIAAVAGYAIGGGHVLHVVCDLTIAADMPASARPARGWAPSTAASVPPISARIVGQKKAREIWYLCEQYDAQEALAMGLVNKVVPLAELEATAVAWGRRILTHSPFAIRALKAAFNAELDGQAGIQELAGHATQLFYMTEEAQEGRNALQREASARLLALPMATVSARSAWWLAMRPATLTASAAPVLVGTGAAWADGRFAAGPALAALLGASLLQIGANFANDVFDFERGADTHDRLGPQRARSRAGSAPRR